MAGSPSQLPRSVRPNSHEEDSSTNEEDSAGRMKVNVQILLTQKNLLVEVMNQDTIQELKSTIQAKIQAKEGIPPHDFDLSFKGELLAEDRTVASLDLLQDPDPTFALIFHPKDDVSVIVDMSGRRVTLGAKFWYTVGHIKDLAMAKMSAQVMRMHMVYQGKQLENHKILASYDIVDGCVLQLVSHRSSHGQVTLRK